MKKHSLLAIAIAIACMPLIAQADITAATLYPSHAELTWQERGSVSAGAGVLDVEGLPVSLQDQSLQVILTGVDGARIRQVQINRIEQAEYVAEETRRLRGELDVVNARIQAQEDSITAWNQQVTLASKAAEAPHELTASELNEMAVALKDTTSTALAEIRSIRTKMTGDIALRDRLMRDLAQINQGAKATKTVRVHYRAPVSGELQVTLRFQSPEARWGSEYNARLSTELGDKPGGEVALEHVALVQQSTGMDWKDVELQLATANPRRGTRMPPVHPWIINPEPPRGFSSKSSARTADLQAEMLVASPAVVERQSTFTQSYRLPQPVDIPSDNSGQRLTIAEHRVPVEVSTWTAPVLNPTGYLHATGVFRAEAPIPSGRVSLYRDGQSVGASHLGELADGEELSLGFGVDEGVRVAVVNELERMGEEGIWKSENVQRRQNRFNITNHHSKAVKIRIFDRLPVSEQDSVTVKPLNISEPVQRNFDDRKGVLVWDREVSAGETVSVTSGFEVRVPEGTELPRL